jgi:chemotaxis protein MotA
VLTVVGLVVVIGTVLGGFIMEGGAVGVLIQIAEFVIIGGAALGVLVAGAPGKVLSALFKGIIKALTGSGVGKKEYMELFLLLFEAFGTMRKNGDMALEKDVDDPTNSAIFSKYPGFLKNHHARNLLCDSLRLVISGSANPHELENLIDEELATFDEEAERPASLLLKVADALPGLGIVAAVLGIVITMQYMDAGPAVIGHKVASALVGTFIGILASYGFLQPIACKMEMLHAEEKKYLECIKAGILAHLHGAAPIISVEHARRVCFSDERPTASALEEACRGAKAA